MAEARFAGNVYAFAWEGASGSVRGAEGDSDLVVVEFWGGDMEESAEVRQEVQHLAASLPFRLVGDPTLVLDGKVLTPDRHPSAMEELSVGIRSHMQVRDLWDGWRNAKP